MTDLDETLDLFTRALERGLRALADEVDPGAMAWLGLDAYARLPDDQEEPPEPKPARVAKPTPKPKRRRAKAAPAPERDERPEQARLVEELLRMNGTYRAVETRFGIATRLMCRWRRGLNATPGSLERLRAAVREGPPDPRVKARAAKAKEGEEPAFRRPSPRRRRRPEPEPEDGDGQDDIEELDVCPAELVPDVLEGLERAGYGTGI